MSDFSAYVGHFVGLDLVTGRRKPDQLLGTVVLANDTGLMLAVRADSKRNYCFISYNNINTLLFKLDAEGRELGPIDPVLTDDRLLELEGMPAAVTRADGTVIDGTLGRLGVSGVAIRQQSAKGSLEQFCRYATIQQLKIVETPKPRSLAGFKIDPVETGDDWTYVDCCSDPQIESDDFNVPERIDESELGEISEDFDPREFEAAVPAGEPETVQDPDVVEALTPPSSANMAALDAALGSDFDEWLDDEPATTSDDDDDEDDGAEIAIEDDDQF